MHLWQASGLIPKFIALCLALAPPVTSEDEPAFEWTAFPGYEAFSDLQVARLTVPMDWNNLNGSTTVDIAVTRLQAKSPERRIGSLFYNPGGPGGLASQALVEFRKVKQPSSLSEEIWQRFDIVGVDLRGTGFSSPIECNGSAVIANLYPDTRSAAEKLVASNRAFRASCLELTGSPLFDYMDTVSIVHDHERVRKALGGEKITWFGQSYGTQLGAQWAELYPEAFRAILLDAVHTPGQPPTAEFVQGGVSTEATFKYFLRWCERQNATTCPRVNPEESHLAQWERLLDKAAKTSAAEVYTVVNTAKHAIYRPAASKDSGTGFAYLAEAIYNASKGIAPPVPVEPPGADSRYNQSSAWGETAVSCADRRHPDHTWQDWQYKKLLAQSEMPLLQGVSPGGEFQLNCAGLPPQTRNPPHAIQIPPWEDLPTVFIVGNVYDPATPMADAMLLRDQIGRQRARYYPRVGAGHTVYFQPDAYQGEAWHAMNRYLLDVKLPAEGTVFQS